jgi:hypothetical protein
MRESKLYIFLRKKKETSVLKTHYNKFLNLLMRKGLKNKQLKFFFTLLRYHKKKLKLICFEKYQTYSFKKVPNKFILPNFSKLIRVVFRLITLKLELHSKKFRKKEILVPSPLSPWRGLRLGLNLLLKNSVNTHIVVSLRKTRKCLQILNELWKTFVGKSVTSSTIKDFTSKVLDNSENFRLTQLFPVNKFRRNLIPELVKSKDQVSKDNDPKKKFLLFLSEKKIFPTYTKIKKVLDKNNKKKKSSKIKTFNGFNKNIMSSRRRGIRRRTSYIFRGFLKKYSKYRFFKIKLTIKIKRKRKHNFKFRKNKKKLHFKKLK